MTVKKMFTARLDLDTLTRIDELVAAYQRISISKVTKTDVIVKALKDLHERELKK